MILSVENILSVNEHNFNEIVLQMFHEQVKLVEPYRRFVELLGIDPQRIEQISDIPFVPTSLFQNHKFHIAPAKASDYFESSGTTGQKTSRHWHTNLDLTAYHEVSKIGFERQFGSLKNVSILALLPSYLERQNASLVSMVQNWMNVSGHPTNGSYLDNFEALAKQLVENEKSGIQTVLIGVSFALLDFAKEFPIPLKNTLVFETGGMKGKRKEITRSELHKLLQTAFQCPIYSEYGMTELTSQAYTSGGHHFQTPPWMRVMVQKDDDPLGGKHLVGKGRICIVDLANRSTCAFISTSDIGQLEKDGTFEVLGRMDYSDIRGCNLMVEL